MFPGSEISSSYTFLCASCRQNPSLKYSAYVVQSWTSLRIGGRSLRSLEMSMMIDIIIIIISRSVARNVSFLVVSQ